MRSWIFAGACMASSFVCAVNHHQSAQQAFKVVHAQELKSWYDQKKAMVILDARSKPYFDGMVLPNAHWLPYDAPEQQIVSLIPNLDTVVVVYCANTSCPAGGWLADRLVKLGYTQVYDYPEGIQDWVSKGYPTTKH